MKYLILALLLMTTACATSKIKVADPASADFGSTPKDYKGVLTNHWDRTLKDPDSIKIKRISEPKKAYAYRAIEKPHGYDLYSDVTFEPDYGYLVCAEISAKNSYGAYNGYKTYEYFFDNKGTFFELHKVDEDWMKGMHRTGSFGPESRLITKSCDW